MPDPIHNSVLRDNIAANRLVETDHHIRKVIDAPEFQRLRNIRQMGLSSYVFPTAEHSRFAHSVGVYATAKMIYRQLQLRAVDLDLPSPVQFHDETEREFCIASLCHDIGHTPFSHVLENTLLPEGFRSHEDCTVALLSSDRPIGKAIKDVADLDAVKLFLNHGHINKALTVLVSGSFDVDRADYILRDSYMCGVNYGQYDLGWLVHAMTLEINRNEQPILVLDGRRGLDSLRQFLSARRYLYRQVYFHAAVRAAQVLLKGIFDRMQDLGRHPSTNALAPQCFKKLMGRDKLSMEEFVASTDIEVLYMIRVFARDHSDAALRYLCQLFLERKLPKSIVDSTKSIRALSDRFNLEFTTERAEPSQQMEFFDFLPAKRGHIDAVLSEVREQATEHFKEDGLPPEAARYLVAFDPAEFQAAPLDDILFAFEGNFVPIEAVSKETVGFDVAALLDSFVMSRLFVPRSCVEQLRDFIDRRYGIRDTHVQESGEPHG